MTYITLGQLLQYYDYAEDPADRIQVVTGDEDWDEADDLSVKSELLTPFEDCYIQHMNVEESHCGKPVIRVAIEKKKGA